ncbi:MAG: hypothetical protein AAGA33_12765, partial [Pseudomonadota bacterium]
MIALVCPLATLSTSSAQESPIPTVPAEGMLDTRQIDGAISAIDAREELTEQTRTEIIDELRKAEAEILARVAAETDAQTFADAFETAPLETARLRAELDESAGPEPQPSELGITSGMTLGELEQILARESAIAASATTVFNEYESEVT